MKTQSVVVRGVVAPVSRAATGAAEPPRESLARPRLGWRNLSLLTAHGPEKTPLQYAVTELARLISPPPPAIHGGGRPVHEGTLNDYVRASLGMKHEAITIVPALRPYLDELSKSEATRARSPCSASSIWQTRSPDLRNTASSVVKPLCAG
jgi:hypothetical protein